MPRAGSSPGRPRTQTGKSVGVVGSGPAGLAAAQQLRRAGHQVVVYEADERPGGMLRFGIPDFKMEKAPLDRRLQQLEAEGVEFRCGVRVGHGGDVSWTELRQQHHALVLAMGARRARELEVPGRELDGVHLAMDYLPQQNRVVAGAEVPAAQRIDARGKRVVILGGGDTGSDCYGTALRQGARSVLQIELFPAPPTSRAEDNPWPEWPLVFRTSSSHEEGGERDFAIMTRRLRGEGGRVTALEAVRVALEVGEGGQKRLVEQPDSDLTVPADMVLLAMGFVGPEVGGAVEELGLSLDRRGNIAVDANHATSASGVFCAGDAARGASLIVWAIAEGRETAAAVNRYLSPATASAPPPADPAISRGPPACYNQGVDEREAARRERARARGRWPASMSRLDSDEPGSSDDVRTLMATTTASERVAMVWRVTQDAWAMSGRAIPDYPRARAPGRVVRRDDSSR